MSRDPEVEILPPDPRWVASGGEDAVEYEVRPPPPGVVSDVFEAVPEPATAARQAAVGGDPKVIGKLLSISWRLAVGVVLLAILVWALDPLGPGTLQQLVQALRSRPILGRVLVVVGIAAGVPFFAPVGPLALIPGYCWGAGEGIALGLSGAVLGGSLNFMISRRFIGPHVHAWLQGNELLRTLYSSIDRRGARVLFGLRLSPMMPFGMLSYLGGLTSVPWLIFAPLMAIGGIPWTGVYAVVGGMLGDNNQAVDLGAVAHDPLTPYLRWGGLALTVALALWLGRVARRDLLQARAQRGTR